MPNPKCSLASIAKIILSTLNNSPLFCIFCYKILPLPNSFPIFFSMKRVFCSLHKFLFLVIVYYEPFFKASFTFSKLKPRIMISSGDKPSSVSSLILSVAGKSTLSSNPSIDALPSSKVTIP